MRFLKTNIATRVCVGPFLDVTDGITPETALTVTGCHLTLVVDNAGVPTLALDADATAAAGDNDMVHITNDDAGMYDLELTAAQLNYVGRAILTIIDTDVHLPVFHEFTILPANVYDSLISGSDALQVHANEITAGLITAAAIANAAIDNATFAADVGSTAYATNIIALAVRKALDEIRLEHLVAVADADDVVDSSIIAKLASKGATPDWSTFVNTTDALEAIRDKETDIETDTSEIGAAGAGLTAVPWNASWDTEVQSEVFDALDAAFTDATSLTANGLLDRLRTLGWIMRNKITVTDANGNTVIYKDDSLTAAFTVNTMLTDDSTITTRLRAA